MPQFIGKIQCANCSCWSSVKGRRRKMYDHVGRSKYDMFFKITSVCLRTCLGSIWLWQLTLMLSGRFTCNIKMMTYTDHVYAVCSVFNWYLIYTLIACLPVCRHASQKWIQLNQLHPYRWNDFVPPSASDFLEQVKLDWNTLDAESHLPSYAEQHANFQLKFCVAASFAMISHALLLFIDSGPACIVNSIWHVRQCGGG